MNKYTIFFILTCLPYFFAHAQHKMEATFGKWEVYATQESSPPTCFAVSEPVALNGKFENRSSPYIVFNRVKKFHYEFHSYSGFIYSSENILLSIDNAYNFKLKPIETEGWPYTETLDHEILKYAPKGKKMTLSSKNNKNESVIDEYSLEGLAKALVFMEQFCK
jgi:hypothetical protein